MHYLNVSRKVCTLIGLSRVVVSSIAVKQECPPSSALFDLCKDEISNFMPRLGDLSPNAYQE